MRSLHAASPFTGNVDDSDDRAFDSSLPSAGKAARAPKPVMISLEPRPR